MTDTLNLQHVNVKLFVDGELNVDLEEFINVFHPLVAQQAMDEMMIDVADYRHVPYGPGVVMVGLEADYSIDHKDGRWGLRYNRKAPLEGSNQDCLKDAFAKAHATAELLESKISGLKFSRSHFELFFNDRALVPNTPQTLAAAQPEIETFLRDTLGQSEFEVEYVSEPRKLFGATIRLAQAAVLS